MRDLKPWELRLLNEREELKERYAKLGEFIRLEAFNDLEEADQDLLNDQAYAMLEYLSVLDSRVERIWAK